MTATSFRPAEIPSASRPVGTATLKGSRNDLHPDRLRNCCKSFALGRFQLASCAAVPKLRRENTMSNLSQAIQDIIEERQRQIEKEGWTPEHDDEHWEGDLARAAACYAVAGPNAALPLNWPWEAHWWKPTDRRSSLIKAGALIAAEIERLDRRGAA
jgi:hypothetical protein